MTDEQGGEAAAVETTTTAASEAAVSSQEQTSERDFEAEARADGWVPEDEFKGAKRPAKFLSAQEFVERGEQFAPFHKRTEKAVDERVSKMEKVFERTVEALKRQHEKELAEVRSARREAIKEGNVAEVERLDEAIETLKSDAPDKPVSKTDADIQAEWVKENPWYETDAKMRRIALGVSNDVTKPGMTLEENLKLTMKALEDEYPEYNWSGKKRTQTAANGHAAVDGGGMGSGPLRGSRVLDSLPNEARQQAKADMAKFPKIYPSAEAWVKAYNG